MDGGDWKWGGTKIHMNEIGKGGRRRRKREEEEEEEEEKEKEKEQEQEKGNNADQ